ncbi:MAG: fimbria/pilus outer membrane usher protein, partial [Burkholderiaceae bacterium]
MRGRSTPPYLAHASHAALLAVGLAAATVAGAAPPELNVAVLTAAAEQDLAVVTVSVNGIRKEGLAYVLRDGDNLLIDSETLRRLSVRYESSTAREREGRLMVPLAAINGLAWAMQPKQQHLELTFDPRAMAMNDITYQLTSTPPPQLPHWGGFVNYGVYGASALSGDNRPAFGDTIGASLAASVFGPYGIGSAALLANPRSADSNGDRVVLLDANWRWDDIPSRTTLLVGDAVSTPGWWGRALRFGGVQFGTNYALQPGFVTYPLLAVSGLATVPSTADILVNNVRVAEQNVPSGPFTISNLPTMTGAGELNLLVRDAFGQQRVVTQPFYIAPQLLRSGLTEFSIGGGAERLNYGLKTLDYGGAYASGWARHGINEVLTGELRGEADGHVAAGGVGADVLVGNIGVFSAGMAASQSDRGNGTKYLVGFDRQTPFVSVGARMYRASEQYQEIGDIGSHFSRSWNVYARGSMGRYGSVAAGYTSVRYDRANALSIYTASYSVNVSPRAFLSLTASRFTGGRDQTQVLALLTIPLDTLTSASVSAQSNRHDGEGTLIGEAYVQRSLPVGEGYGYYLRANTERVASGGVTYAGPYGRYTLEASGDRERAGLRATAAGGIAWVGDSMMFAQPIEQGFALVRVGELEGVRVLQS